MYLKIPPSCPSLPHQYPSYPINTADASLQIPICRSQFGDAGLLKPVSLLMPVCKCHFAHASFQMPIWEDPFVYISLNCTYQLADASFLMLVSTYQLSHAILYTLFCTSQFAHTTLHMPVSGCQIVNTSLHMPFFSYSLQMPFSKCYFADANLSILLF